MEYFSNRKVKRSQNSGLIIVFFQHSSNFDIGLHTQSSSTLQSTLMPVKCFLISVHSVEVFNCFSFLSYVVDGPHVVGFSFLFSFVPIFFPFIVLIFLSVCFT